MIEMIPSVSLNISIPPFEVFPGERVVVSVFNKDGSLKQVVQDSTVPQGLSLTCRTFIGGDFKTISSDPVV